MWGSGRWRGAIGAGGVMLLAAFGLAGCGQTRDGGELRLKHVVTIATPQGERTVTSVVAMRGYQTYNRNFGGSGWGGITCALTGDAVRTSVGARDFYFLLTRPGTSTAAWNQIELIKDHFGLPNHTDDDRWIGQWRDIARSGRVVDLKPEDYPAIAVMPRDGWMNDARVVSLEDAAHEGLRVVRYRLEITQDPVGGDPPAAIRYREGGSAGTSVPGRESFTATHATA